MTGQRSFGITAQVVAMRRGPQGDGCAGVYFTATAQHHNVRMTSHDPNIRVRVNQATIYYNANHIQTILQTVHKTYSTRTIDQIDHDGC